MVVTTHHNLLLVTHMAPAHAVRLLEAEKFSRREAAKIPFGFLPSIEGDLPFRSRDGMLGRVDMLWPSTRVSVGTNGEMRSVVRA